MKNLNKAYIASWYRIVHSAMILRLATHSIPELPNHKQSNAAPQVPNPMLFWFVSCSNHRASNWTILQPLLANPPHKNLPLGKYIPLRPLLVQNSSSPMRARDQRILAKAHAAAAVAAEVGHDAGAVVVDVAGCAALGGRGGGLILFARHFVRCFL